MSQSPADGPGGGRIAGPKRNRPHIRGADFFWNPATSYSPGRFQPCCFDPGNSHSRGLRPLPAIPDAPPACFRHWRRQAPVPQGAHGEKPSQVQCMHLPADGPKAILCQGPKQETPHLHGVFLVLESGNVLLSRAVSSQVPSALKGLTSVFGMGTGGSLSPLSPEFCQGLVQSFVLLALAASLHNRSLRLGNSPHIRACSSIRAYPENRTSKLLTSCFLPVSNFPFGLNSILWIKSSTD